MIFRTVLPLVFSLALSAQQSAVNFEVHAAGYPKNHGFQVELKLRYRAFDDKKIIAENRRSPARDDILLEHLSTNTHKWDISFDESGKAEFKGSPQEAVFSFPSPLRRLSNAHAVIQLVGRVQTLIDGQIVSGLPLTFLRPYEPGATYVLLINSDSSGGDGPEYRMGLMLKDELADALAGKPLQNRMPGPIPRPGAR